MTQGKNYISSIGLVNVFRRMLKKLKVEYSDNDIEELFLEIEDFIPKKITE